MADEVRVDPVVLDGAAGTAGAIRDAVGRQAADVEPETLAAARELTGWLTGRSVEQLLWQWRDDLRQLGSKMDGMADGLTACARDYRYTDRASAEHFRAVR